MSTRLFSALIATAALTAGQAYAFGEAGPLPVTSTATSTVSASALRAEAQRAQRAGLLVNGEAGQVLSAEAPGSARTAATARRDAAAVRAAAQRIGSSGNGEAGGVADVGAQGSLVSPSDVRAGLPVPTL